MKNNFLQKFNRQHLYSFKLILVLVLLSFLSIYTKAQVATRSNYTFTTNVLRNLSQGMNGNPIDLSTPENLTSSTLSTNASPLFS
jgi:hypothetical protein